MRTYREKESFQLDLSLSEECLLNLCQAGIGDFAREAMRTLDDNRATVQRTLDNEESQALAGLETSIASQHDLLLCALQAEAIRVVTSKFE